MAAAVRTQVYLTSEQRTRIDALRSRDGRTLAEVIRDALDAYLERETPDIGDALSGTFGTLPELEVPSRYECERD